MTIQWLKQDLIINEMVSAHQEKQAENNMMAVMTVMTIALMTMTAVMDNTKNGKCIGTQVHRVSKLECVCTNRQGW